jgi:hypothetical protein
VLALAARAAAAPATDDDSDENENEIEIERCEDAPVPDADDRDEPEPDLDLDLDLDPYDADDLLPIAGVPELIGTGAPWRMSRRRSRLGAVELSVAWRRTAYAPIASPPHTAAELWLLATWRQ